MNGDIQEENFSKKNGEKIEYKQISKIVSPSPLLAEYQIKMIVRISEKYVITLHKVLQIFLNSPLLARLEKYYFSEEKILQKPEKTENPARTFDIFLTKNEILSAEKLFPYFGKKIVMVFPDDILLENFRKEFDKNREISEKIFYIFSDSTDLRKAQAWIEIFSGKFEIIA